MMQRIAKSTKSGPGLVNGMTVEDLLALNRHIFGEASMKDDDDADDDGADADSDDTDDDTDDDGADDASGDDKDDKKDAKKGSDRERELAAEARKRRIQARDERERADRAERALQELKDKDKPEVDKLNSRVAELETTNTKLTEDLAQARLHNAFLSDNTHEWHDPADALRLADLSEVEVDEDGKAHGLKEALKKLAKEKPHLLKVAKKKSAEREDDSDDEDEAPTGYSPNGRGNKDKSKLNREKLLRKYPATRR